MIEGRLAVTEPVDGFPGGRPFGPPKSGSENNLPVCWVVARGPKHYEFIGFGAMEVTKPYEFIGFGSVAILAYVRSPLWLCF